MATLFDQVFFDGKKPVPSFYNTIHETGDTLKKSQENGNKQESRILAIFQSEQRPLTPFDVEFIYKLKHEPVPITSIRRAITNLTKAGKLEKSLTTKPEKYGKANYTWKLPTHI